LVARRTRFVAHPGRSVRGRFNFLLVDFVSLLARFISLFGRLGNSLWDAPKYQ